MTRTQQDKEKRRQRMARENKKALHQRVQQLEKQVADAEQAIADLEARMSDPETYRDPEQGRAVADEHARMQQLLSDLMEEWTEAAELDEE